MSSFIDSIKRFLLLGWPLWSVGCGALPSDAMEPRGARSQALSADRHQLVTRPAVESWVNEETAAALAAVSTIGDDNPEAQPRSETHFDNCYWEEGRDFVLANREAAVSAALAFAESGSDTDRQVCFDFLGYVFHAVQDHYAHSNWVETHEPGELAPLDVPDEPPPNGWFSGTVTNPGDTGSDAGALHCPSGTPSHEELNKDDTGSLEADEAFFDAALATTDQLAKFVDGVYEALPDDAERVLTELGFVAAPARTTGRDDEVRVLASKAGPYGFETPSVYCPEGSYAVGFSQRVEADTGDDDDTALNSVVLLCEDTARKSVRLSAWEGTWGTWSSERFCPRGAHLIEAQLALEAPQGDDADDRSATAARFGCSDGAVLEAENDASGGAWGSVLSCPARSAVCGLSVQYQPPQGDDADDTAQNGMKLHCCSAPDVVANAGRGLAALPRESEPPSDSSSCSVARMPASPAPAAGSLWGLAWCCALWWRSSSKRDRPWRRNVDGRAPARRARSCTSWAR